MESAKEKAIREAYGERYEGLKQHLDENGWFPDEVLGEEIWVLSECERRVEHKTFVTDVFWRISGLEGVETNNGWTRIESEADLPTDGTLKYHSAWFKDGKLTNYEIRPLHELYRQFNVFDSINVYQPIVKPQPPIY